MNLIILQDISNTHRDSIFYQASLPKRVWELAMIVIDLYEQAKLKGQKLNLANLMSKPDFKQQYLAPIRALDADNQCLLLQRVIDGELSLNELKTESSNFKQMQSLRLAFVRLTNSKSWDDAKNSYPAYASDAELCKFMHLDLKKAIPKPFSDFCNCLRAKTSEDADQCSEIIKFGTASASVF